MAERNSWRQRVRSTSITAAGDRAARTDAMGRRAACTRPERAGPRPGSDGSAHGGSSPDARPWWSAFDLGADRLERHIGDLAPTLSEGHARAQKKHGGPNDHRARSLYAILFTAVRAEGLMRQRFGVHGETHPTIAAGLGTGPHTSVAWLRTTGGQSIKGHDLVSLIAGECLCPPVRRWLGEQIGFEMGFIISFDAAMPPSDAPESDRVHAVEERVLEILAAVGYLSAGVRDFADDGFDDGERARLLERINAAQAELARAAAVLG